jgi:hypothetical protein
MWRGFPFLAAIIKAARHQGRVKALGISIIQGRFVGSRAPNKPAVWQNFLAKKRVFVGRLSRT